MKNRKRESSERRPVERGSEIGGGVSAPRDWLHRDDLYAPDGRKVKDAEHVGASSPDADADGELVEDREPVEDREADDTGPDENRR